MSDDLPPTQATAAPGPGGGPERFADDRRRYRLDSRIATGGMGEVWRGTDTTLGREVAVKLLKAEYADDPAFRQRFEIEARHAAALHHPNVAGVFDVGESTSDDGSGSLRPFLVMELIDGEPLSTLLRRGVDDGRSLDREVLRDLMAQAGDAVGAAHAAGIVHRDIKPANLMVTPQRQVKITDFGIARAADAVGLTQTGAVMGTPQYLSPEQARGETATPRSDVYSLGVVAFECLAGRRPFEADSPVATALAHLREPVPDLPPDVPSDLAAVVQRALAKDPADRFADGTAFAVALRDPATAVRMAPVPPVVPVAPEMPAAGATQVMPATGAGPVAAPATPAEPVVPVALPPEEPERRRSGVWLVLGLVLLLAAAVAVLVLALGGGGDDEEDPDPRPTREPSSQAPTQESEPAEEPTEEAPSEEPPPEEPTPEPTPEEPTEEPTTEEPTQEPTEEPTEEPTQEPTEELPATPSAPAAAPTAGPGTAPDTAPDAAPVGRGEEVPGE
ncbi:serine/threonine-protein kinase [Nocardioides nanhaiensis]|uniref:non-specific serine/threonine protein kinase n=1 Tax=Nocardioides nanhaiensis TaxID=1476871 RepID=A0ABP8WGK3_9ACTN